MLFLLSFVMSKYDEFYFVHITLLCRWWLTVCPDGFSSTAGVNGCFMALTHKMTWSAGGLMCKAYNDKAHLLVINSAEKQAAISLWTSANSGNIWTGVAMLRIIMSSRHGRRRERTRRMYVHFF